MHTLKPTIEPATLSFRNGIPYSEAYGDAFYSPDGAAEVHRVFLDPVGFDARIQNRDRYTMAETGFGAGLNFVVAAERYLNTAQAHSSLHFISCEAHPFTQEDAKHLAPLLPATSLARSLLDDWPPLLAGWHRRVFAGGRITLSVFFGSVDNYAYELGQQQRRPIDQWLFDGFAPDRNPAMWRAELLNAFAGLVRPGGAMATYTASGEVRRCLEAAGFSTRRVDQKPHKSESLAGERLNDARSLALAEPAMPNRFVVHGAGFAGASAARSLAERGVEVEVIDPSGAGAGASGLPAIVVHGRLLADRSPAAELRAHAFNLSFRLMRERCPNGFAPIGALQGPGGTTDAQRLAEIARQYAGTGQWLEALDAGQASEVAGVEVAADHLWFPNAGVINGTVAIAELLEHPMISLRKAPSTAFATAPALIAAGPRSNDRDDLANLEILPVAGQLDVFRGSTLRCALLGEGYAVPIDGGHTAVGATYEYKPWAPGKASEHNLALASQLGLHSVPAASQAFRAARAVTSDRTPIVGATRTSELWISAGHGSMGATFAPLAGEIIASLVCGEVTPVSSALLQTLAPTRFEARQAKRGLKHGARAVASITAQTNHSD